MDDVVQVSLWWVASRQAGSAPAMIALKQAREGKRVSLGEGGDLFLPADVLGQERVELVERSQGLTVVHVPPGARAEVDGVPRADSKLLLERGNTAQLAIGSFLVRIEDGAGEAIARGEGWLERLRSPGAGCLAGSAFFHVSIFAAVSLVAPVLAAAEEDTIDRDRLALMQRMLDASAQRERERPEEEAPAAGGEAGQPAAPAMGAPGAAGRPDTSHQGRLAIRGDARPADVTMARERALAEATSYSVVSALAGLAPSDPNAPVAPWGTVSQGSDDVSRVGNLFGATMDDAMGNGGLGLSGSDQGGGGTSNSIGIHGIGPLGSTGVGTGWGMCAGPAPCRGKLPPHVPHLGTIRSCGASEAGRGCDTMVNGRLPPEVIQRVVRMNSGRYRFCYEKGLQRDPSLRGRVSVKFMIDRTGAVAVAAEGDSDLPDEGVRRCVVSSFLGLSFPQPENGTVTVIYPLIFSPE
jgi:hypothetical protein